MNDEPSVLCKEDVDKAADYLRNYEFQDMECVKCRKTFCESQLGTDGKCDECFFSQFPKEKVIEYYKSFLE